MPEKKLTENQVKIGSQIYTIEPTKMKHIKQNFYSDHMAFPKIGFVKLLSTYSDGEDLVSRYLKAVFNLEELPEDMIDNLDAKIISEIRTIVNRLNEMEDEDSKNEQGTEKEMI